VVDATAQSQRASLVAQYNNVLAQINTTTADASFNGVNLLNGVGRETTTDPCSRAEAFERIAIGQGVIVNARTRSSVLAEGDRLCIASASGY
jgi:flagellin-like hook-associated protein FlgL